MKQSGPGRIFFSVKFHLNTVQLESNEGSQWSRQGLRDSEGPVRVQVSKGVQADCGP